MTLVLRKIYEGYDYYFNESKGEFVFAMKWMSRHKVYSDKVNDQLMWCMLRLGSCQSQGTLNLLCFVLINFFLLWHSSSLLSVVKYIIISLWFKVMSTSKNILKFSENKTEHDCICQWIIGVDNKFLTN